jgi:hypothetical protein
VEFSLHYIFAIQKRRFALVNESHFLILSLPKRAQQRAFKTAVQHK